MPRVSVCYVAGPVLCVGSLGAVSVRDARYVLRIRASILRHFTDSYVFYTVLYGYVRLFKDLYVILTV